MRYYERPGPLLDVLEEFFEEAVWLYRMRRRALVDPERGWQDLADLDRRMLAHLDGLALGGRAAAALLKDLLCSEEPDGAFGAFVAATVLPRLRLVEPMEWLADAIASNPPHRWALVEGLALSSAPDLGAWLGEFLRDARPLVRRAAAEAAGRRRANQHATGLRALTSDPDPAVALAALGALADWGETIDSSRLASCIALEDPADVGRAIEISLLTEGRRGLDRCRERCADASSEVLRGLLPYLAAAGDLEDADRIARVGDADPALAPDAVLALGLSGNARHVSRILAALDDVANWPLYRAAFQALRFISGRDPLPSFDPSEPEPGAVSAYTGLWKDWWAQAELDPSLKWRRGRPLALPGLLEDLERPGNPLRHFTQLEARVRFASPVTVQFDALYATQKEQVEQFRRWVESARQG